MNNSSILKAMVEAYKAIGSNNKGAKLQLCKEYISLPIEGNKSNQLQLYDRQGINFILVEDKPLDEIYKEKSERGVREELRNTILNAAKYFYLEEDESFNSLVLYKRPFKQALPESAKAAQINRIQFITLINILNELVKMNQKAKVLILGVGLKNAFNPEFYRLLYESASNQLIKKLHFGKRIGGGYFYEQWMRGLMDGLESNVGVNLHSILKFINEESIGIIKSNFQLDFMLRELVIQLNRGLEKADDFKDAVSFDENPLNFLLNYYPEYAKEILIFEELFDKQPELFFEHEAAQLKGYLGKEKLEKVLHNQFLDVVNTEDWEEAARYRDKIRTIQSDKLEEIYRLNRIKEGFNPWKNTILLVMPSYSKKQRIVKQFLKRRTELS